ncbi:hypothetical protein BDC45DRAFT_533897 [Circinella umbellata]|nr:hypothetical protein BDC45DRAFT_533897 [Circinella umbellata]
MAKTIAEQTKELKVQDGKLQLFQKLIEENEALKAQVANYKKKLQYFESQQQQPTVTLEDVTNNTPHDHFFKWLNGTFINYCKNSTANYRKLLQGVPQSTFYS